ncbi:hypothetical protein B0T21DRAFT_371164 [Apiosordaria backusii]|uniref:SET domain-containing protein n=1 Tax=Apiosordaria backusii TaxID=314023 RepID=A0AA40E3Y2_9PEZI|nr:hypothetical protein B0T21DRAFT_371164 [Apiosordaria backusii]
MNTHQAQDFPQIVAHIEEQKRMLRNAQSRAGQRPARKNRREETILRFNFSRLSVHRHQFSGLLVSRTSFIPSPYAPCAQPLSDLSKIMIDDLVLETHHRGTYLLVRVVTPQDWITAVMAIVEDERGEVLLLQLYHQVDTTPRPEDILAPGTVLIIKDPYLKLTADGGHGLRADHVSDIVFLPAHDDRIPSCWRSDLQSPQDQSASFWKAKGNDCFGQSRYRAAVEYYTRALVSSPTTEESHTIKLNRSLAFLKTNHFDAALADVESLLSDTATKAGEKALFRKAQALYGLQRFRECCDVLTKLRVNYPNNTAAKAKLNAAVNRLAEQTTGKYHFKKLQAEASQLRPPWLDHATYIGPVEVRQSGCRGKGVFTTKAVKAGDLLFCEKAFVYAFSEDGAVNSAGRLDTSILIDVNANSFTTGAQPELITMLVQKLYRNPSLASLVQNLHRGSYEPVQGTFGIIDGNPVLDTFLLTRILLLNNFGCLLSDRAAAQARRQLIGLHTSFHNFPSCGLWAFASHINHSCISNAHRSFIGDMMIVRATEDLPVNTEITIQYLSHLTPQRQQKFVQNWAFACDCALCQDGDQTSDAVIAKRSRLAESLQSVLRPLTRCGSYGGTGSIANVIRKSSALLAELEGTYTKPVEEVPRIALWGGYRDVACALTLPGQGIAPNPQKAVELGLKALQCLGFVIEGGSLGTNQDLVVKKWGFMGNGLLDCWMCLKNAYYKTGSHELALAADGYAKVCYRIQFGEDETFGELD